MSQTAFATSENIAHIGDRLWWEKGIIYQVYPRSFADGNGDGVGDLKGVISRLDYLKWLGVDAVWLSPFYPSPMADFGYDISDYCNVDPLFGDLADFDELSRKCHELGLRIILDFVPNHTSDQHPWFQESRSSRDNPRRDWYIWRDPKPDGSPPNNWLSQFGGSAWEFDEHTGQYYYHGFLKEQPDLNWRNPEVEKAMFDILRFWLERGVDGFRVDVLWHIIKDDQWRDNPVNPYHNSATQPEYDRLETVYSTDRPEVHDIIFRMRETIESYGDDKLLIGEIYLPTERLMAYYGPDANGTHMPYNFQLSLLHWDCAAIMEAVDRYESHLPIGAWPNWVLGNHDRPRIASRVQPHQVRGAQILLLTLRGTPTMYYGDELGMRNVEVPIHRVRDPYEIREPGKGNGRDPERSPMVWNDNPNHGFTIPGIEPWLPMGLNAGYSVSEQKENPDSILNMVRELILIRKRYNALSIGSYQALPSHPPIAAYSRHFGTEIIYVIINFDEHPQAYPLPDTDMECLFSSDVNRKVPCNVRGLTLSGGEGVLLKMTPAES